MTEKELLYVDDLLSHLEQMNEFYNTYIVDLEDEALKDIIEGIIKENKEIHKKFCKLLENEEG